MGRRHRPKNRLQQEKKDTAPQDGDAAMATSNTMKILGAVKKVTKTDTEYSIKYDTGEKAKLNILNSHVFRYHMSPTGEFPEYPKPNNPDDVAKINSKRVTDYDKEAFLKSSLDENDKYFEINTAKIKITLDKIKGTMTVFDKRRTNKEVLIEARPLSYADNKATQILHQHADEFYFGGGMQNGRFTHKDEVIEIVNSNDWTDGGVTSPCPFYWSSYGYGVLRNTWQPGIYDFRSRDLSLMKTIHQGEEFDAFVFVNPLPRDILNDYYELTGKPIFMPEYAFYEAHLNAFNRDYWVKVSSDTPGAILYEDGEYYKCYQPNQLGDKTGILESLNGEKNNYQFSARAMIDRYKKYDLPLAWFLPNDGYGCGYGQTDTLDGDIENLKEFGDYARSKGVEVALWTESQLEPEDPENPKRGERDLAKEVKVAGVQALKCDVAWIGHGYSFGLNAVENAANIFVKETHSGHRPMIIMVDGWAGTQRYSGIWSGDQYGGEWEYIRFHIPTYVGSGLSGQPIVGSDMDGIFGGKSREVNIRDFQWKTFTPLQLNMDGWGWIPKTPFSFDEEATALNRAYLKFKAMLMPYNYTVGYESTHGLPMVRAMFLEFPKEIPGYTNDSKYQFMWGPYLLVAPIYNQQGVLDASIRDGIYLPDPKQVWIDLLTGEKYQGGKILNNLRVPLWKIPVFVKDGAIIPMTNPNNNPYEIKRDKRIFTIYPNGETNFEVYEDDGISSEYLENRFATTNIKVIGPPSNDRGDLLIIVEHTKESYKKMVKERTTLFQIMASENVDYIKAAINGESVLLHKVGTEEEFNREENVYYFKKDFAINPYLNELGGEVWKQNFLLVKIQRVNITSSDIHIKIRDYINKGKIFGSNSTINEQLRAPQGLSVLDVTSTTISLKWTLENDAIYYEIERDGIIFTNISGSVFNFEGLKNETKHYFRIRSVNDEGVSEWSPIISSITEEDPYKHVIKGIKVKCNVPCQPSQTVCKLTDGNAKSLWHTKWNLPDQIDPRNSKIIKLEFDLRNVYTIDKIMYIPREDAGNGTILELRYRYSIDGKLWSPYSEVINWEWNNEVKTIEFYDTQMRYVEIQLLNTIGGFGSGRQMLFYKSETIKGVKATCNIPSEPGQEIGKLTDGDTRCLWHTKWSMPHRTNPNRGQAIKLNFDLGKVYEIDKLEYLPRNDDCRNGTFEKVQYMHSTDSVNWSALSEELNWECDPTTKTIIFNGIPFRYLELQVLKSCGGFGSGRQIFFYKSDSIVPTNDIKDPYQYVIKHVKAWCNVQCQPGEEIYKFTNGGIKSNELWHTRWDQPNMTDPKTGKIIKLDFHLGDVYEVEKAEYYPRDDSGNGNFLKIQYRHSLDGITWSPLSDVISWPHDETVKTIDLKGEKMQYLELRVLDSVKGYGSGKQMLFYRKPN